MSASIAAPAGSGSLRQKLSMDNGWEFHFGKPGDIGENTYLRKSNSGFHGAGGSLTLPHDWAVSLPPDQTADNPLPGCSSTAHCACI